MKNNGEEVLLTERFQMAFDHLGYFSCMSAHRFYAGVERSELKLEGTDKTLSLLIDNNIIEEREGLLYLNKESFFKLSMWDLLILTYPWVDQPGSPVSVEERKTFKKLCQSFLLHTEITDCLRGRVS